LIIIVTNDEHRYTHRDVAAEDGITFGIMGYSEMAQRAKALPEATYIFTDVDRLDPRGRRKAAHAYRALRSHGQKVLNDPARMMSRFGLLRALNRAGINDFDAYLAEALETPRRWPVFLRTEGNHSEPVSGLLNNADELDEALAKSIKKGVPLPALLIIEYAAEEVRPGLFRKLSVFRVGDRMLGYTCVHDDQWIVKYGKKDITPDELYEEEHDFVVNHRFAEQMRPVFELAGVDYGRVDFGLVGGKPQIYEINSNPDIKLRPDPSPSALRNQSNDTFRANYLAAMRLLEQTEDASAAA